MRAARYSGYGIMPELTQVADPGCPADGVVITDGTLRPGLLVGNVIGLEDAGRALAAMDGPAEEAGMTVIRLRPSMRL